MRCPNCRKNEGIFNSTYGWLICTDCQTKRDTQSLPDKPVEMTTPSIKQQRREYQKSILQPRRDGIVSKEYLAVNGTKGFKATPEEVAKAENVWSDTIDSENLQRTK